MTTRALLTPARGRGLAVLLAAEARGDDFLPISNVTTEESVYWQTANWLIGTGLARAVISNGIQLTAAGRDAAKVVAS